MQEQHPHTVSGEGTQGTPYTPEELALIEEIAPNPVAKAQLAELFPQRRASAVKKKLTEIRRRMGLAQDKFSADREPEIRALEPDDPGEADNWFPRHCANMMRGNTRFLEALRAA
jgi:hypothetical protein